MKTGDCTCGQKRVKLFLASKNTWKCLRCIINATQKRRVGWRKRKS